MSSSEQESCLLKCDEYSPDSLKESISVFFKELSEIEEDTTVHLGILSNDEFDMSPEEFYLKAWGTEFKIDAEHNISIWGDVSSASKAGSDAPSMGNAA